MYVLRRGRPFPAVLDEGDRPRRVVYTERTWCDAGRLELRQPLGQCGHQGVAAPPVGRAHPVQVPVELAMGDEVGEGELVERGRAAVAVILAAAKVRGGGTAGRSA
jgi:hypothetical protein